MAVERADLDRVHGLGHLLKSRRSAVLDRFVRVNRVLQGVEPTVKSWFVRGLAADLDRLAGGEGDELAMWSIADARALAWRHGGTLWRLRAHPLMERAYLDTLSGLAELASRGILV